MKLFKVRNQVEDRIFNTWVVAENEEKVRGDVGGILSIEQVPGFVDVIE